MPGDDQSLNSTRAEFVGAVVEDRLHGLCPEAAPLVLLRNDVFSVAANVRSIRSTLRSSARSSPANPPRAFSFSNSASYSAAVPCISRRSTSATVFFDFGSLRFRNIATFHFN